MNGVGQDHPPGLLLRPAPLAAQRLFGRIQAASTVEPFGERELQRIREREASLVVSAEDYVYRYRRDLSFTADGI